MAFYSMLYALCLVLDDIKSYLIHYNHYKYVKTTRLNNTNDKVKILFLVNDLAFLIIDSIAEASNLKALMLL